MLGNFFEKRLWSPFDGVTLHLSSGSISVLAVAFLHISTVATTQAKYLESSGSIAVRMGDLFLKIPSEINAAFDPAQPGTKTNFNYDALPKTEEKNYNNVDSIYIQLDKLWPITPERRGAVLMLQANPYSVQNDWFCSNPLRTDMRPDASKSIRIDGDYLVYNIGSLIGELYIENTGMYVFGEPITGLRRLSELYQRLYPGQGMQTDVSISVSKFVVLKLRVTDAQVAFADFAHLMNAIEEKVRKWVQNRESTRRVWPIADRPKC